MSMTDDSGERKVAPASPLFASSWLALYFLLKEELENLKDGGAAADTDSKTPPRPPRPN